MALSEQSTRTASRGPTQLLTAGVLAAIILVLALTACSGESVPQDVNRDPEQLTRALVEASYRSEQMHGFLWDNAAPGLRTYYELDQEQFRTETSNRAAQLLQDGTVNADDARISYSELASVRQYDVAVSDPTGTEVAFFVSLMPAAEGRWSYCEISVTDPRLDDSYVLIGDRFGNCW